MNILSKLKSGTLRAGLLGALGALSVSAGVYAADGACRCARVSDLLKARLPKTEVGTMDCDKVAGLCEVVAGKSLFYVDHGARYLFIGRVYDMQTRQDLTAAKLLEINPGLLLGGAANAGAREEEGGSPPRPWPRMAGHCWPAQGRRRPRRAGSISRSWGRRARWSGEGGRHAGHDLHRFPLRLLPRAGERARDDERARDRAADLDARQP
jgi:thiol:disulfide interchange protein DsbC